MNSFQAVMKETCSNRETADCVLGIGGSPRRNGNSDILLQSILEGATGEEIAVDGFQLRDVKFQGCVGCERCRKDKICTGISDGMSLLYPQIIRAKGLVVVSPTHNYNVTAWMKAFIDRLYCFYNFENTIPRRWSSNLAGQGRKAVVAAICEQESKQDMGFTLEAMRLPLEALGYEIVDELSVFRVFAKGKVRDEEDVLQQAVLSGRKLAKALV